MAVGEHTSRRDRRVTARWAGFDKAGISLKADSSAVRPINVMASGSDCMLLRPNTKVAVFSGRAAKILHLASFLGAGRVVRPPIWPRHVDAVAGWGYKPTADRARAFAQRHRLPYLALEDGFLRSVGLGVTGVPPHSLVVDDIGIYYNANRPSRLEVMLNEPGSPDPELLAYAAEMIALMRRHRLSKYNGAPEPGSALLPRTTRRRVLVVDQTRDDMSVILGRASESTFRSMLQTAMDSHPGAEIVVKLHPETIGGRKRGYLSEVAIHSSVSIIADDINPWSLLERCDHVYTVSSQMGFEALLAGLPVTCHGVPFYAGWGATDDRLVCPRRKQQRSPTEIFAAAYLRYARYVDPIANAPCDIMRTIELLAEGRRFNELNRGTTICLGMQRWKRRHLRPFLASTGGRAIFARSGSHALRKGAKPGDRVLIWGNHEPRGLSPLISQLGAEFGRVEDGFMRSIGLGSDFIRPSSLVIDWQGVHFDPTTPSDLETVLASTDFPPEILDRAASLRRKIAKTRLSKYNVGRVKLERPEEAEGRTVVLIPGQVGNDASVRHGGGGMAGNLALVDAVREARPDAYIVWKPHPDVVASNRASDCVVDRIAEQCDAVWFGANIHDCLDLADEVHTLTSLTGFEALLRDKRVVTYGGPFYAGWGLTEDRLAFPRRRRRLSIDQLVAGALILYPRYYDWESGNICSAEAIVERMARCVATRPLPADVTPLHRPDRVLWRLARYAGGWIRA